MTMLGFITCRDSAEAEKIADVLLVEKLIACANIVKEIHSKFLWKGKLEESSEALLVIKTRKYLVEKIFDEVKKLHSYKLLVIEFVDTTVNKDAWQWIEKETRE